VIKGNSHKYSVSAQCKCLGVARATYYRNRREKVKPDKDADLKEKIEEIFLKNRRVFGAAKIKRKLFKQYKLKVSLRRIRRIMKELGLESVYGNKKYKTPKDDPNESKIPNLLDRNFNDKSKLEAVVSDLTYARVRGSWHYVCILLDLFNREIIGYSAGARRNALLIRKAFAKVKINLMNIQMFHSDRGSEYDNQLIDDLLEVFEINRSLSLKACPYDNAVAESTFKMIKAEFIYRQTFDSLEDLERELEEYVEWYNNERPHSTLGYLTPSEYKKLAQ